MLSDQLEADWRATLVEAAVHGQRRHPGRVEKCGVAQYRREIPLRHFIPFRGSGSRCGHHWDIDVLLIPVMAAPTPTTAEWDEMAKGDLAPVLRYTALFNSTGMPALTMNGGFDKRGAPIGFQLVGKHLSEDLLLRVGHSFQSITDWHTHHPASVNPAGAS